MTINVTNAADCNIYFTRPFIIILISRRFIIELIPEKVPLGYKSNAREHSQKTHALPIPPKAKGEANYQIILNSMKTFMGEPTPILFTTKDNIPMIKSFIQAFIDFGSNDDIEEYRVYPLHELFFNIKELAVKNNPTDRESFKSIHIAEEHLRSEKYVYLAGSACAVSRVILSESTVKIEKLFV